MSHQSVYILFSVKFERLNDIYLYVVNTYTFAVNHRTARINVLSSVIISGSALLEAIMLAARYLKRSNSALLAAIKQRATGSDKAARCICFSLKI